ncbi:hypothetical protein, partial [Lactobacillus sp. M0396]|uniref:hypothetical protein n=1 Tax=Lactobacillus sp. M0396 TaxID=2751030 RepID=UPI001E4416D1
KIRISDLFACEIDFALLFWVLLNPHIFAKTLFSFQGTTFCFFKTAFLFSQIHSLLSSTFSGSFLPSSPDSVYYLTKAARFCQLLLLDFFIGLRGLLPCGSLPDDSY